MYHNGADVGQEDGTQYDAIDPPQLPIKDWVVVDTPDKGAVYVRPNAFPESYAKALRDAADEHGYVGPGTLKAKNARGVDVSFAPDFLVGGHDNVRQLEDYQGEKGPDLQAEAIKKLRDDVVDQFGNIVTTGREFLDDMTTKGKLPEVLGLAQAATPAKGPATFAGPPPDNMVMQNAQNGGSMSASSSSAHAGVGPIPADWVSRKQAEGAFGQLQEAETAKAEAERKHFDRELALRQEQHTAMVKQAGDEAETMRQVQAANENARKAYEDAVKSGKYE